MSDTKTATLDGIVLPKEEVEARPGQKAPRKDDLQAREAISVRNGILWTVIPVLLLMGGLMLAFNLVDEETLVGADHVSDVTVELLTVHKAATEAGILQIRDTTPAAMDAWKAENNVSFVRTPELGMAGMAFMGARALTMPGGTWAMMQFSGAGAGKADLLAVGAPKGNVAVPNEAVEGEVDGVKVFMDRVRGTGVAYIDGPKADWMLVSSDDEAALTEMVKVLVADLT